MILVTKLLTADHEFESDWSTRSIQVLYIMLMLYNIVIISCGCKKLFQGVVNYFNAEKITLVLTTTYMTPLPLQLLVGYNTLLEYKRCRMEFHICHQF